MLRKFPFLTENSKKPGEIHRIPNPVKLDAQKFFFHVKSHDRGTLDTEYTHKLKVMS